MSKVCVIGIGNAFRRDDGVGLVVARQLRDLTLPGVTVLEQGGEGLSLMEAWGDADRVIVIDAVSSGSEPGHIHRFEVVDQELPDIFSGRSTHAFGLAEAIELARQLQRLPAQLVVYGIEGNSFEHGVGLSVEVDEAVVILVEQFAHALDGRS